MKTRYFQLNNGNKVDLKYVSELAKVASLLKDNLKSSEFSSLEDFSQLPIIVNKIIYLLGSELSTSMKINNRILIFHDDLSIEFDNDLLVSYQLLVNDKLGFELLTKAIHFKLCTDYIIKCSCKNQDIFKDCALIGAEYNNLVNDNLFVEPKTK